MPKITVNVTSKLNPRSSRRPGRRLCNNICRYGNPADKTCPLRPSTGKANSLGGRCKTCGWNQCNFARSTAGVGQTTTWWDMSCLSFSLCITYQIILSVQLKFAPVLGIWTFSLILQCCVEGYQSYFSIPPPWWFQACIGGQVHVTVSFLCSNVGPFNKSGGGYLDKSVSFFWYIYPLGIKVGFTFSLMQLKVGVNIGHKFVRWRQQAHCWRTDGRRRRRRYGKGQRPGKGGRRRAKWGCHWRIAEDCDLYTCWYVHLTIFGKLRLGFECWEWAKGKRKEGWLFFEVEIPKGIGWRGIKWKWDRFGNYCCFRKYNR